MKIFDRLCPGYRRQIQNLNFMAIVTFIKNAYNMTDSLFYENCSCRRMNHAIINVYVYSPMKGTQVKEDI